MGALEEMHVEVQVHLDAPPEQVFALLSDVERMAGLGPEHAEARWVDGGPAAGAAFVGRNVREGREWELPCRVTAYDPPRRFAWDVGDDAAPTAYWSYDLVADGSGTRVTQVMRHGPGFSFLRKYVERYPDRADELVEHRSRELEANMRTVLGQVERLLSIRT